MGKAVGVRRDALPRENLYNVSVMQEVIAVYVRTSREFKGVERISDKEQVADATELIQQKKLPGEVRFYIDLDRSGSLPPLQWREGVKGKYREEFTNLLTAIEQGEIKTLIVRKRDRLARNTVMALRLYELLKRHEVRLLCTHEALPEAGDNGATVFTYTILAAAAEFELSKIKDNVRAAKAYCKKKDMKLGPAACLGYADAPRKEDEPGRVVVNTETASIVQEMFAKFVGGLSATGVRDWLMQAHPNLRKGNGWYACDVMRMLANPYYIGMRDNDGNLEPSKVYPPIVDATTFWKAQEILKARKHCRLGKHERKQQQPHLLSGFLKCGGCGRNMQFNRSSNGQSHALCIWKHLNDNQKAFHMRESEWQYFVECYVAPLASVTTKPAENPERALLLTQLAKIDTNIAKLQVKIATGGDADLLIGALEMAKTERDRIQRRSDALPPAQPTTTPWTEMTFDGQRACLMRIVDRIDVYHNHVIVAFKGGPKPERFPLMRRRDDTQHKRGVNCLVDPEFTMRPIMVVQDGELIRY